MEKNFDFKMSGLKKKIYFFLRFTKDLEDWVELIQINWEKLVYQK